MKNLKTLVLGASENPERYSNKAIRSLQQHGVEVVAVGLRKGKVGETEIHTGHPDFSDIDTVTLYLSGDNQRPLYDYILSLKPRRIIYNPGAENAELEKLAAANGLENLQACTLVLLATNQY